jgi:hypothetical protein
MGTALAAAFGSELVLLAGPFALAFAAVAGAGLAFWFLNKTNPNVNTPEQDRWIKKHGLRPQATPEGDDAVRGAKYGQWMGKTMLKYGLSQRQLNLLGQEYLREGHSFKDWQMGKANIPQLQKTINKLKVSVNH